MKQQKQKISPSKTIKPDSKNNNLNYCLVLFVAAFVFYGNSISNDFALDDLIVITGNSFTQKGFSGIKDIMSHDAFVGAYGEALNLSGGRYRPLSIVSFAIEKEIFGYHTYVFHFFNVLFFALTGVLIFLLVKKLFPKQNDWIPFVAALLFVIHPLHTEVVANIKSRDEIFALMYSLLTMFLLLQTKKWSLPLATLTFFLALLSKENAITFLLLIPLALFMFTPNNLKSIFIKTIPLLVVTLLYLFMRAKFAGMIGDRITTDIMDDSYMHATFIQKIATITQVQLRYLVLLILPYQLCYDYSYNQIPLVTFSNPEAIISLIIHVAAIAFAIINFKKNKIVAYCIIFYFATFSIVSNLVFNIGTSMAERFAYMPSFGFCLMIAWLLQLILKIDANQKLKFQTTHFLVLGAIVILAGTMTISRNKDWDTNYSLYKADIDKVPNSARSRLYYGIECIGQYNQSQDKTFINEAMKQIRISCGINPDFHYAFHNLGVAYQSINLWKESVGCYKRVLKLMPTNEQALYGLGLAYGKGLNQPDQAIPYFRKLVFEMKLDKPDYWESLGLCYALKQDFPNALNYFRQGIEKNPDAAKLYYNVGITYGNMGVKDSSDYYINKATSMDSSLKQ